MKEITAYLGMDGQIYSEEQAVREADERYVVDKMAKELEALYAEKAGEGQPTKVFAVYRNRVREVFERWEKKLKTD